MASGRGKTMSFVVALWTLPGDRYRFGSSFLMLNDLSPVALAFETHAPQGAALDELLGMQRRARAS